MLEMFLIQLILASVAFAVFVIFSVKSTIRRGPH